MSLWTASRGSTGTFFPRIPHAGRRTPVCDQRYSARYGWPGSRRLFTFPIGTATAVYLEEYAPRNKLTQIIELNIANLAGVPSIVYGLLGLAVFVSFLSLGRVVIAGAH